MNTEDQDTQETQKDTAEGQILAGGRLDMVGGNMGGPSNVKGIVGGRGATGGGSNANMGGNTGITTSGTAGGTSPAATTDDLGGSDLSMTGDLGATTAGPEGDMGELADQLDAAVTAGATIGHTGNTFADNSAADITDRGTAAPYGDRNAPPDPNTKKA